MESPSLLPPRSLLVLLLLVLPLLLPGLSGLAGLDVTSVARADEEDPADDDGDDPFGDDGDDPFDDDTFEGPTSFTKEQVDRAIERGVAWLRSAQDEEGSWGVVRGNAAYGGGQMQGQGYGHPAGPTALALYTLLKCKVPEGDGTVRRGFAYLDDHHRRPGGSYEASTMLLALCATANPYKSSRRSRPGAEQRLRLKGRYKRWAMAVQEILIEKQRDQGWRYQITGQEDRAPEGHHEDLSSTQLAALGLFAARQAGIKTPDDVWEDILQFSLAQQDDDGPEVVLTDPITGEQVTRRARGFAYIKGASHPEEGKATGSMTACGIANILMARHALTDGGDEDEIEEFNERPDAQAIQDAVEDGLIWLQENWSSFPNPGKRQMNVYHIYWLYAVERAMDLVGRQRIGDHLWYSEMGQQLIDRQTAEGYWDSNSTHEPRKVLDTCFALLFLKKATKGMIPPVTGGAGRPVDNR